MVAGVTERMEHQGGFWVILLVLASLLNNVAAEKRKLDMAPDAVDDTFSGCLGRMMNVVTKSGGLLQKELKASPRFAEVWRKGEEEACEKHIPGGNKYHTTALQAYGNSDDKFRKDFNNLVYTRGSNSTTYVDGFPFKSLHFLLTDVFRLSDSSQSCITVFYGTNNEYGAKVKDEVRFGKFIRAELQHSAAAEAIDEQGTLFNITSCSVIKVDDYVCNSEEVSYLVSPNEAFQVKKIRSVTNDDDVTYTEITLTHSRFLSIHDCYLTSGAAHDDGDDPDSSSVELNPSVLALITSILVYLTLPE